MPIAACLVPSNCLYNAAKPLIDPQPFPASATGIVSMILTCPACSTRYLLDPGRLSAEGRVVRCAKCSHSWAQKPPDDMPMQVDVTPAAEEVIPIPKGSNLPAFVEKRPRRSGALGWLVFVATVAIVIGGGIFARDEVIASWQPAARLYALVGLGVEIPGAGLELRNVRPSRGVEAGVPVLVIEGEIANVSSAVRDVPKLRAILRDNGRRALRQWSFSASEYRLLPGETIKFKTRTKDPPATATDLSVAFLPKN